VARGRSRRCRRETDVGVLAGVDSPVAHPGLALELLCT
jgi:hypothetical protein